MRGVVETCGAPDSVSGALYPRTISGETHQNTSSENRLAVPSGLHCRHPMHEFTHTSLGLLSVVGGGVSARHDSTSSDSEHMRCMDSVATSTLLPMPSCSA